MLCLLKNLHTAPLTVSNPDYDVNVTIPRGHEVPVTGDYRDHLFTKAGMMACEVLGDEDPEDEEKDVSADGVEALRAEYKDLFGKQPPSAMKAGTLRQKIDEKRAADDDLAD